MKRFRNTFYLLFALMALLTACGKEPVTPSTEEKPQDKPQEKPRDATLLVAYFSFSGNTKAVATSIAGLTGGTLYMIEPEVPYGSENNNYYDESTRAYKEQYGPASVRPAIKKTLENADSYDIILLGFPIWYGKAPRVVFSFLDAYPFKGKTVIPFITSGSTGISSAASELKSSYTDITWKTGDRLNGRNDDQLKSWLKDAGVTVK